MMPMTDKAFDNLKKLLSELNLLIFIEQVNSAENFLRLNINSPIIKVTCRRFFESTCPNSTFSSPEGPTSLQISSGRHDDLALLLNRPSAADCQHHKETLQACLRQTLCREIASQDANLTAYFLNLSFEHLVICSQLLPTLKSPICLPILSEALSDYLKKNNIAHSVKESCEAYFNRFISKTLLEIRLTDTFDLVFHTNNELIMKTLLLLFEKMKIKCIKKIKNQLYISPTDGLLHRFLEKERAPLDPTQIHHAVMECMIVSLKILISKPTVITTPEERLLLALNSRQSVEPGILHAIRLSAEDCLGIYDQLSTINREFRSTLPQHIRSSRIFQHYNPLTTTPDFEHRLTPSN